MLISLLSCMAFAQGGATLKYTALPSGMTKVVGFYVPQRLELAATAPAGLSNVPAGATGYATLMFGGKTLNVVEIDRNGIPFRVLIDERGKGDFRRAGVFTWTNQPANPKAPGGTKLYRTEFQLPSPIAGGKKVTLSVYRFDPSDAQRAQFKSTILYYADYGLTGTATIGGKTYKSAIVDFDASGTFDNALKAPAPQHAPNAMILIDRNGDGKYSSPYEVFEADKPFNIGGTTYEVSNLTGGGAHVGLTKSSQTVAEIPVPQSFGAGKKMASFTATDVNGKTVHFPEDFKGKVVMLDFWATWCGPCMGEVPTVVSVYNQLHPKGFEILGISLDNEQTLKQVGPVTKDKGMTWNQVADGKYWKAAVAQLYGIQSIPQAYIVDGDTGMIYAEGENIRGENLLPAVQKALSEKNKSPK